MLKGKKEVDRKKGVHGTRHGGELNGWKRGVRKKKKKRREKERERGRRHDSKGERNKLKGEWKYGRKEDIGVAAVIGM